MWEIGVLLIGIGVLIVCIFLATTIKDLGLTLKKVNQMLDENERSIHDIMNNAANITGSVDDVVSTSQKAVKALTTFGAIKSITSGRKRR